MITRIAALVATALVAVSPAVAQDGAPPAAAGQDAVDWDEVVRTAVNARMVSAVIPWARSSPRSWARN